MDKPSVGNWLTAGGMIVGLIAGYVTLQTEVKNIRTELDATADELHTLYVRKDIYDVNSRHINEKLAAIQVDLAAIRKDLAALRERER